MSPLRFGRRQDTRDSEEDPVVRRYRFLLRTTPGDALETAHHEAIASLDESDRATILATAQEQLVAAQRLTTSDLPQIAHLVTLGEQR